MVDTFLRRVAAVGGREIKREGKKEGREIDIVGVREGEGDGEAKREREKGRERERERERRDVYIHIVS